MPLTRQKEGEDFIFSTSTWNAFADATEKVNSQDLSSVDKNLGNKSSTIVWVKNTSGAARDRFDVLKLGTPLITPAENANEFKNRVGFNAVALDSSPAATPVILLQPLAANACGRGVIMGATPAYVEILDADHVYAKYSSSHPEYLESANESGPIKLLYNPGGECGFGNDFDR